MRRCTASASTWSARLDWICELTACPATSLACQAARSVSSTMRNAQPSASPVPTRPARPNICCTVATSMEFNPTWVSRTTTARAGRFTPAARVEVATSTSMSLARNARSASRRWSQPL